MLFKNYFFQLDALARKDLAERVGTSVGHLTNFSYGYTMLNPAVCVAIERESACAVTRQELRPSDWKEIWPELIDILPDAQCSVHRKTAEAPEEAFLKLADGLELVDRRVALASFAGPDRRAAGTRSTDIGIIGQGV